MKTYPFFILLGITAFVALLLLAWVMTRGESTEPFIPAIGDEHCKSDTEAALHLLKEKVPGHARVVVDSIGVIECVSAGSGMYAWEDPPRYAVGDATRAAGTIWYAGTIVHDACHAKQYQDFSRMHPDVVIPDDVFTGRAAEAQCLAAQEDALEKIGASQETLQYVRTIPESNYHDVPLEERWW